ncbi:MAG: hypothetical protein J6386_13450 [Candidatus Synoicihabitans palmerolidicus]|nr:hypothetical protein [Candidatus Synoicihabitans palmerolidicus]
MTLVIRDQLTCPPTWCASFRDLTLYCHTFLPLETVLESEDADLYYQWITPRGGMDFIEDIVRPGSEPGLHLDLEHRFPCTLVTDRIAPENLSTLLNHIKGRLAD